MSQNFTINLIFIGSALLLSVIITGCIYCCRTVSTPDRLTFRDLPVSPLLSPLRLPDDEIKININKHYS